VVEYSCSFYLYLATFNKRTCRTTAPTQISTMIQGKIWISTLGSYSVIYGMLDRLFLRGNVGSDDDWLKFIVSLLLRVCFTRDASRIWVDLIQEKRTGCGSDGFKPRPNNNLGTLSLKCFEWYFNLCLALNSFILDLCIQQNINTPITVFRFQTFKSLETFTV